MRTFEKQIISILLLLLVVTVVGCSDKTNTVVVHGASKEALLGRNT